MASGQESNKTVFPEAGKTDPVKLCALKAVCPADRGSRTQRFGQRLSPGGLGGVSG